MRLIDRKRVKKILEKQGKSKFHESANHAIDGIQYTIDNERNFRIELIFAIIVTIMSYVLNVSILEWTILILTIGIVLALEMVNTSIERVVDLVTKDYLPLAKYAKDVSAGAVLIMSMFSVAIGILIFLPKIIDLMK